MKKVIEDQTSEDTETTQEDKPTMITMSQADLMEMMNKMREDITSEVTASIKKDEDAVVEEEAIKKSRGFKLDRTKFGDWYIKRENGGKVPKLLQGTFTEAKIANRFIATYAIEKEKAAKEKAAQEKEVDNAKSFAA